MEDKLETELELSNNEDGKENKTNLDQSSKSYSKLDHDQDDTKDGNANEDDKEEAKNAESKSAIDNSELQSKANLPLGKNSLWTFDYSYLLLLCLIVRSKINLQHGLFPKLV